MSEIRMPNYIKSIDAFREYLGFIQRDIVERGNTEKDNKLRKSLENCVEYINKAVKEIDSGYAPIHINYKERERVCPTCGKSMG